MAPAFAPKVIATGTPASLNRCVLEASGKIQTEKSEDNGGKPCRTCHAEGSICQTLIHYTPSSLYRGGSNFCQTLSSLAHAETRYQLVR